ncbi:MAG: MFS transporter [Deltaproteobacteria bacterium]|nr:MFS transporter [Deltaproteobacteria bacterium]
MYGLFLNRGLRILLVTNAMILLAGAMLGPIYAIFVEKVGGNLLDASIAVSLFALVAGLSTLISGRYTDKVKEEGLIVVLGYSITGIGNLLYIRVDTIWFLFFIQIIIGLGESALNLVGT